MNIAIADEAQRVGITDVLKLCRAESALKIAVSAWFTVAVLGQLIFVFYIFALYGRAAVEGQGTSKNPIF